MLSKATAKQALLQLSVEEENLASFPFAVLESRVGKRVGKLEISGTKLLPDGREIRVSWQVQGNAELGLPTEQDLDIFVALGVITFRSNFAKTITFSGREIAKILGISGVHGKFYQRLKVAMDRFVPLRFRAVTETDRQEEIKWLNVFQEASFALDRTTGRCTGTITWTDKLIQSMNSGFFRVLDAGRYMDLDGITVKHMYRFLAVAFEKTDVIVIDARKLAAEHLGMLKLPRYFSRLMQTLEPAFDQLIRIEVLGSYHITNSDNWEIALHRHNLYVPERKTLLLHDDTTPATVRETAREALEVGGLRADLVERYCASASTFAECQQLERAGRLLRSLIDIGVLSHVAVQVIDKSLEHGLDTDNCRQELDWCEIALDICQEKLASGQKMKNPAGIVIKIARDPEARERLVAPGKAEAIRRLYRQRENRKLMEHYQAGQRQLVLEYEEFRDALARTMFEELPEATRQLLRNEKAELVRHQGRWERLEPAQRQAEVDNLVLLDLARSEVPPFEKWLLRKRAAQVALPFACREDAAIAN